MALGVDKVIKEFKQANEVINKDIYPIKDNE